MSGAGRGRASADRGGKEERDQGQWTQTQPEPDTGTSKLGGGPDLFPCEGGEAGKKGGGIRMGIWKRLTQWMEGAGRGHEGRVGRGEGKIGKAAQCKHAWREEEDWGGSWMQWGAGGAMGGGVSMQGWWRRCWATAAAARGRWWWLKGGSGGARAAAAVGTAAVE